MMTQLKKDLGQSDQPTKEFVDDLLAASKEIPSLSKGERNPHGGYNFVGIDAYYEKAAPILRKHNIGWSIREVDADLLEVGEKLDQKSGNMVAVRAMKYSYEFDVYHPTAVMKSFFTVSVLHPLQGAQTSGSAMSYASKMFIRNVFSVVTGEGDADSTSPQAFDGDAFDMSPKPPPPKAPTPKPELRVDIKDIYDVARIFIDQCRTVGELQEYWDKNSQAFNELKTSSPGRYKTLVDMFKKAKESIIAGQPVIAPPPDEQVE